MGHYARPVPFNFGKHAALCAGSWRKGNKISGEAPFNPGGFANRYIVGADVSPHEFRSPKRTKIGLSPILPLPFRRSEGRGEGSVWSVRHFRSSIVGSTRIVECSRA